MRPGDGGQTSGDHTRILDVRGGIGGLAAAYESMTALADRYDAAAAQLCEWAELGAGVLTDPALVSSAPLAPSSFAAAEAAVTAATTGPDGVLTESSGWELDALLVRAARTLFEGADEISQATVADLDRRLGLVVGLTLHASLPVAGPLLLTLDDRLPSGAIGQWATSHPDLVEHAANGGGGLLTGLLGLPLLLDNGSGSRLLTLPYDDGAAAVRRRPDLTVPAGPLQPEDLAGLMNHLQEVAALSPDPDSPTNGTIEIQTLDAGTEQVRHIVYLPGTDDLRTLPWTQDVDVRDLGTDLRLMGNLDDAYRDGILEAMHQAGIGPHEPVLLVGHSQGGMEAVSILANGSDFDVTHVVTAGSPTAQVPGFPVGSHVLSLEQRGDLVPLLDGRPNPDSVAQTTVTFEDGGTGAPAEEHRYHHYVSGAAAADASSDPSVVEQLDSLHGGGFLSGPGHHAAAVTSQVFQVVRDR